MLMGCSVGSNVGQAASAKKQMEQRLVSLGVDDEVIRNVGEASRDLAEADESRGYVQSALSRPRAFAATLKRETGTRRSRPRSGPKDGDDDAPGKHLTARIALTSARVAEADGCGWERHSG